MRKPDSKNPDTHDKTRVMMGLRVSPEIKALCILTAERMHMTMADVMIRGLYTVASEAGIIRNGMVTPESKQPLEDATMIVKSMNNARSGNGAF